MRISFTIETSRDGRADRVADADALSSARRILADAWERANESGIDPDEAARRHNWVGGAVRIYATVAGMDPAAVLDELKSALPAIAPSVSRRSGPYDGLGMRFVPTKPKQSKPHPGAQRPVDAAVPGDDAAEATSDNTTG